MSNFDTLAQEFLAQKRIAVAGVSRNSQQTANLIYKAFRDRGYKVFPINPNADTLEGDSAYPNLQSIPGGVDGVLIVTKPDLTDQIVRDAVEASVPRVWMHNNTFGGTSASDYAIQYGRENGLTVISGGCPMMFFDFGHKCMKWVLGAMGKLPN
ncbi:MAG: CoA-binding protein [Anaerolineales bacterium]|nr:CoA-binding protein [Anaerolineales bacterium]